MPMDKNLLEIISSNLCSTFCRSKNARRWQKEISKSTLKHIKGKKQRHIAIASRYIHVISVHKGYLKKQAEFNEN